MHKASSCRHAQGIYLCRSAYCQPRPDKFYHQRGSHPDSGLPEKIRLRQRRRPEHFRNPDRHGHADDSVSVRTDQFRIGHAAAVHFPGKGAEKPGTHPPHDKTHDRILPGSWICKYPVFPADLFLYRSIFVCELAGRRVCPYTQLYLSVYVSVYNIKQHFAWTRSSYRHVNAEFKQLSAAYRGDLVLCTGLRHTCLFIWNARQPDAVGIMRNLTAEPLQRSVADIHL